MTFTVALGFDSFVIIRHGYKSLELNKEASKFYNNLINVDEEVEGSELGCYFCNDVTAPGNSISDRTLDQQCTISRSGISMIASGVIFL